jgi:hypothetical protein
MGYCQVGLEKQSACDPDACADINGQYSEEPGKGSCLLLTGILEEDDRAVLMINTQIYPSLIDFRKGVLHKSDLGERMLRHYDRFHDEAVGIARSDEDLVMDIIWSLSYISPFIRAMMGDQISGGIYGETPDSYYAGALRPGAVQSLRRVIERFKRSASPEFSAALTEFDHELREFEGLNPREALVAMRKRD